MGFKNTGKKRGGAFLLSSVLSFEFIADHKDKEGRFVLAKGKLEQDKGTLCNIYTPPGSSMFVKEIFILTSAKAKWNMYMCR